MSTFLPGEAIAERDQSVRQEPHEREAQKKFRTR
jgi:hypothetical protein